MYKFVSTGNWKSMRARGRSPLSEGVLYVARFNDDGSGDWLPLVHGKGPLTADNGYVDQGDVLVKTRQAASALGATRMDRLLAATRTSRMLPAYRRSCASSPVHQHPAPRRERGQHLAAGRRVVHAPLRQSRLAADELGPGFADRYG